jgi:hypothetical protein
MSIKHNLENLLQNWAQINRLIIRSQDEWNDNVRKKFEHDYWRTIDDEMPNFFQSLEELDMVIKKARQNVK